LTAWPVPCTADAMKGGTAREEIEDDVGPLEVFIAAALAHPTDDEGIQDLRFVHGYARKRSVREYGVRP
jgi:hypothetical protein